MAFSSDGALLGTGSTIFTEDSVDTKVQLWDVPHGALRVTLDTYGGVSRNWCKWPPVIKTISDPRNEWRAGSKSAAS